MARYKKIYYIPGVISLLILPILFVVCLNRSGKSSVYNVLPLIMWNKDLQKKYPTLFIEEYPASRRYEDINITGIQDNDEIKLAYSQIRIREILQQNNAEQGVHYHFADSSNYGAFVKALNILQIENAQRYVVEDNNIWFYNIPPDTTRHDQLINCMLCNDVIYLKPQITIWKRISTRIREVWNSAWLLIVSFSILLFVSLWRLKRTLQAC